jgi:lipid-A-disaccharide synthase
MTVKKRIFISAGEQSGDMHAAGLVRELLRLSLNLEIAGLGGDNLEKLGVKLLYHCRDLAAMGFWEVAKQISFFFDVRNDCVKYMKDQRPDLTILVDYPGMNLKLAKVSHGMNIPTAYFIMPQVWAWKPKRIYSLKRYCHSLLSILPFEREFFNKYDAEVNYIGHPLIDIIPEDADKNAIRKRLGLEPGRKIITFLPGSREQELHRNLPPMRDAFRLLRKKYEHITGVIIKASDLSIERYKNILHDQYDAFQIVTENKYEYIKTSDAAVVASGTATLETALCGTPAVVVYRTSLLTYMIAKRLVKIDTIALANLVAGEKVFPELIQNRATAENISAKIAEILDNQKYADDIREKLAGIRHSLKPEKAYNRGAKLLFEKYLS